MSIAICGLLILCVFLVAGMVIERAYKFLHTNRRVGLPAPSPAAVAGESWRGYIPKPGRFPEV